MTAALPLGQAEKENLKSKVSSPECFTNSATDLLMCNWYKMPLISE